MNPGRLLPSLATVLVLLASNAVRAECECLWRGSFSEVQAGTSLVVSGTISRGRGNSIDLMVDQVLRGEEYKPVIRIWLKMDDLCRPEPSLFPPASQWVMALQKITEAIPGGFNPNTPNISYGRVDDYSLSSCGGYWLSRNDKWVTGNLVGASRWVREPKMTPVLLELVADYVAGRVDASALMTASTEDPALRELILNTRDFLRQEN